MARVTDSEVKAIKAVTIDTTPFIDAANTIVSDINSKCNKSFDETRLTQIELYLSAHFVGVFAPSVSREKFENADNTFQVGSSSLSGVMSDKYGQTANMLSDGCLTEFDKSPATVDFL